MNRRTFIQSSAIALASGITARGANDRINVAVIGVRGRGRDHITSYSKIPDARVAAVCDIDQAQIERDSESRYRITFAAGGKTMRVILEASSIRNPFGRNELSGFRCGM